MEIGKTMQTFVDVNVKAAEKIVDAVVDVAKQVAIPAKQFINDVNQQSYQNMTVKNSMPIYITPYSIQKLNWLIITLKPNTEKALTPHLGRGG